MTVGELEKILAEIQDKEMTVVILDTPKGNWVYVTPDITEPRELISLGDGMYQFEHIVSGKDPRTMFVIR